MAKILYMSATSEYRSFVTYVQRALREAGRPNGFVLAVSAYAEAVFCNENGIGTPEYNSRLAEKKLKRLPIADDEKAEAQKMAESMYPQYLQRVSPGIPHKPRGARTPAPAESGDTIRLSAGYLPSKDSQENVIQFATGMLSREPQTARGPYWDDLVEYVYCLLRGGEIPRSEIEAHGLNPNYVLTKTVTVARNWNTRLSPLTQPKSVTRDGTQDVLHGELKSNVKKAGTGSGF